MKKILCLIDSLGSGGAERQMVGLAVLLNKRGYKVDLVAYHGEDFYLDALRNGGIEPFILKVSNTPVSKLFAVFRFITQRGGYDWVIAYKGGACSLACILKMFGMKFKLIVSERNTTQAITRRVKMMFRTYKRADYIVPNSYSQEKFIKEHFPHLINKTITITNFTDLRHFTPIAKQHGDRLTILTTARIAKQKNVINYLDAIALLRDQGVTNVHFDWFGNVQKGQEDYGKLVLNHVKDLQISDLICFHPATPQILEYYQKCDVFCLPSVYEGFPNVICEAMSCGKPILCSRVCDNPLIVEEGQNALMFDPANVEDMSDRIKTICAFAPEELEKWGQHSRELAVLKCSEDLFVNKYIELIES